MSRKTKALEARRLNMISAQSMSDDQAANMPGMYPEWSKEKHWISTVDANVWEPGVYGWEEQS